MNLKPTIFLLVIFLIAGVLALQLVAVSKVQELVERKIIAARLDYSINHIELAAATLPLESPEQTVNAARSVLPSATVFVDELVHSTHDLAQDPVFVSLLRQVERTGVVNYLGQQYLVASVELHIQGSTVEIFEIIPVETVSESLKRDSETHPFFVLMSLLGFVIIGGGIVLLFVLTRFIFSPLEDISRVAADLSQGKLDTALPSALKHQHNELGELARSFDRMLISLRLAMKVKHVPKTLREKKKTPYYGIYLVVTVFVVLVTALLSQSFMSVLSPHKTVPLTIIPGLGEDNGFDLFDIILTIPEKSNPLNRGYDMLLRIELTNFGGMQTEGLLTYVVTHSGSGMVYLEQEKRTIQPRDEFLKTLPLSHLPAGDYNLYITLLYGNTTASTNSDFNIV